MLVKLFLPLCLCFMGSECMKSRDKLNVTLYYEALCPGSQVFVVKQLYPAWQALHDGIILRLIPYGHAAQTKVNGNWQFSCQHGPEECYGNKIQGCIVTSEVLSANSKMALINCLMKDDNPETALSQCAATLRIDASPIETCADSTRGDDILALCGDETHSLTPKLRFVPAVYINERYDPEIDKEAMRDLKGVICRLAVNKPKGCVDTERDS